MAVFFQESAQVRTAFGEERVLGQSGYPTAADVIEPMEVCVFLRSFFDFAGIGRFDYPGADDSEGSSVR